MKLDLLKMLRDNSLYQEGLKNIPENEREAAQKKIEDLISEMASGMEQFAALITSNDEMKEEIRRTVNEDGVLVIDENRALSGSLG
jgi:hypothetical protein